MPKNIKWGPALLIATLALGLALPAAAEEKTSRQSELVVTATKTEEDIDQVPSTTFVVSDQEIREKAQWSFIDAIRDVPGLWVRSNGPFGGVTSITMRGTSPGQTRVMLDGVRLADPIAADGTLNLAYLQTAGIGQVEVMQGPQSPLYGSDAMAGAINIITRRGQGAPRAWASGSLGSYTTWQGALGAEGQVERFNFMVTASGIDTDGISKVKGGSEDDPFYAYQFNGRLGYDLNDNTEVYFIGYANRSRTDYDGFSGSVLVDSDDYTKVTSYTGILGLTNAPFAWWNHKLTLSYGAVDRDFKDTSSYTSYLTSAEWQHNLLFKDINTLTLGLDWEQERGKYSTPGVFGFTLQEKTASILGLYAQDQLKVLEGLYLLGGVRNDHHDDFGDQFTWRVGASYTYEPSGTTVKGTYGTGFKAPSLFQLYSPYGSLDLQPEKSKGWDLGVVQRLWDQRVKLGLTYFNIKTDNLINFDLSTWTYANIAKTKSQGLEFLAQAELAKWLQADFTWTYTDSQDEATGQDLRYVPRDKGTLGLRLPLLKDRLNIRLWALYVGPRYDDAANTLEVDSYITVNGTATFRLNKWFSVFGSVLNLLDEDYVEIQGYNTLGLSGFLGVRLDLP